MSAIIDLGGPDGGRFWRVTTGEPADHPYARAAAIYARAEGSVGSTYNGVTVERVTPTGNWCKNCGGDGYTSEQPVCPACNGTGKDKS